MGTSSLQFWSTILVQYFRWLPEDICQTQNFIRYGGKKTLGGTTTRDKMAAATAFSVLLSVTSYSNTLAPSLEWHCLQSESCSYSSPSVKSKSSPATFTDFSQYRGNLNGLASGASHNEVTIQDGSGLYGSSCSGDCPEAVLYYVKSGRDQTAYCPIVSFLCGLRVN